MYLQTKSHLQVFNVIVHVKGQIAVQCDDQYKQIGFETLTDLTSAFFRSDTVSEEQLRFTSNYLNSILRSDFFEIPGCQELYICSLLKKNYFSQ